MTYQIIHFGQMFFFIWPFGYYITGTPDLCVMCNVIQLYSYQIGRIVWLSSWILYNYYCIIGIYRFIILTPWIFQRIQFDFRSQEKPRKSNWVAFVRSLRSVGAFVFVNAILEGGEKWNLHFQMTDTKIEKYRFFCCCFLITLRNDWMCCNFLQHQHNFHFIPNSSVQFDDRNCISFNLFFFLFHLHGKMNVKSNFWTVRNSTVYWPKVKMIVPKMALLSQTIEHFSLFFLSSLRWITVSLLNLRLMLQ